jgi:hypothetical protein
MDKNQVSQEAPAGDRSTGNRQPFYARLFLLALLLAFSLAILQPVIPAQAADQRPQRDKAGMTSPQTGAAAPDCSHCERAFVECMASGGGVICAIQYDACIAACLEEGAASLRDESPGD